MKGVHKCSSYGTWDGEPSQCLMNITRRYFFQNEKLPYLTTLAQKRKIHLKEQSKKSYTLSDGTCKFTALFQFIHYNCYLTMVFPPRNNEGFEIYTILFQLTFCIRETPKQVLLQKVKTQMKNSMMLNFIRVYTV